LAAVQAVPNESSHSALPCIVRASTILIRAPLILKKETPFETAFYEYQRHLEARLASKFPVEFYFKKGSLAEQRWLASEESRRKGDATPTPKLLRDGELTGEERIAEEEDEVKVLSSHDDPSLNADLTRVDRLISDTLYFIVKYGGKEGEWRFPYGQVSGSTSGLKDCAENALNSICHTDAYLWYVGTKPVGMHTEKMASGTETQSIDKVQIKVCFDMPNYANLQEFYMKARILAGQLHIKQNNPEDVTEHAWVTREELPKFLTHAFWTHVKAVLPKVQ
jgi:large subunit ribosomal protein L46